MSIEMSLNLLHAYVNALTAADAPSTASRLLGNFSTQMGNLTDTTRPIVVRCPFPINSPSHAVIDLKPSIHEEDLAIALYELFPIQQAGGVIIQCSARWIPGFRPPWTPPGEPILGTGSGDRVRQDTLTEGLEMLGSSPCGIMELAVMSERQFACCQNCGHQGVADAAMLQRARKWCLDVRGRCVGCIQRFGLPLGVNELFTTSGTHIQTIRD